MSDRTLAGVDGNELHLATHDGRGEALLITPHIFSGTLFAEVIGTLAQRRVVRTVASMEARFAEYVACADQQKPMHASTGCGRGGATAILAF